MTPPTANLTPNQTATLAAETKDANGNVLTGRTVTWATSSQAVATVSGTGVVTGVSGGSATITATSEGKSGTATISVADGFVGTTGGTVTAAGGNVKLDIPAGAVAGPLTISVAPNPTPPPIPALTGLSVFLIKGTGYNLGPEGTTFSQPVTVTLKYDPANLPAWVQPGDLMLLHHNGTQWEKLPGQVVDPVAHTIKATSTSFSPYAAAAMLPPVVMSPLNGQVNLHQISAQFTATLPGHTGTSGLQFSWTSTNQHGAASGLFGADGQYTMTNTNNLPPGSIDQVMVTVSGNIDPLNPTVLVPLSTGQASVDANLQFTYEVTPDLTSTNFAGVKTFDAGIKDGNGAPYNPNGGQGTLLIWTESGNHGKLDIANPNHQTSTTRGTYTAKTAALSAATGPRIDKISADFYVGYMKSYDHIVPGHTIPILNIGIQAIPVHDSTVLRFDVKSGTAAAFVEVAPKVDVTPFSVRTTPSGGGACVTAVANVAKHAGATSYTLDVTNIGAGATTGPTYHRVVAGTTNTGSILDIFDGGTYFGVPLDGGCAQSQQAIASRQTLYQTQYGGATFLTTVAP